MSRDSNALNAAPRPTGRQQASLRDHLNEKIAPYVKAGMIKGLENEVEFPLQWLGEYLINQSIIYEGNPDTTNIKAHFKYNFDAPAPPPPPPALTDTSTAANMTPSSLREAPMTNGTAPEEQNHNEYVNGDADVPAAEIGNVTEQTDTAGEEELQPGISAAAAEDIEMHGTS